MIDGRAVAQGNKGRRSSSKLKDAIPAPIKEVTSLLKQKLVDGNDRRPSELETSSVHWSAKRPG